MKNETFGRIDHVFAGLIRNRVLVIVAILAMTIVMGVLASRIEVKSVFSDLLPTNHPYVQVNQRFKSTFGGSNMVSIMLEAEKGDIFNVPFLRKVQDVTKGLQLVEGVDTYQIISLASKKLKEVRASTEGVESRPLMWPELPRNDAELAALRESVLNNPLVYGPYVSMDLKATLEIGRAHV